MDADHDVDVLEALADQAEKNGWVAPTFRAALIARERIFPTGLPTQIPVAIPHADTVHVLKSGLGVAVLARPVQFGEMGGAASSVDARVAVMILVQDPREQILLLTQLIGLFQTPDWFDRLEEATDLDGLVAIFGHLLTAEAGS
ncbi:PTS sugar transporter subunit IIA [Cryobacterium suzukii]|uniref:PTS sugar transporter subunit IIA n=1 Tax=Cryobacterium suzukii TaxID=1259198 RepID=UPI00141AFC49|nr:PTS sugar transporter subunit IIA [Cryobacterium suzukii]